MSKILVTGGSGTIGKPLVTELRRRGHDVWITETSHQPDLQSMRADVAEYRQIERVLEMGFEYVYHLAAEFGRLNGEEYFETLWKTNVIGTRNVLELQRRLGFKLIFASSSEIYGDHHAEVLSEEIPLHNSIIQQNDYAVTKWVNEIQIMNFETRHGTQTMRLRFFNAYGPGEYYHPYRSVVCLFCYRALHDLPYQVYEGYHRVFMHIDDFTPTLANACDRFIAGEVVNVGGREFRSVRELSDLVLGYLGKEDSLVEYLPEDRHNVQNKRPDISKAERLLGHDPTTTLEEGVPQTIDWMRDAYGLVSVR